MWVFYISVTRFKMCLLPQRSKPDHAKVILPNRGCLGRKQKYYSYDTVTLSILLGGHGSTVLVWQIFYQMFKKFTNVFISSRLREFLGDYSISTSKTHGIPWNIIFKIILFILLTQQTTFMILVMPSSSVNSRFIFPLVYILVQIVQLQCERYVHL